VAAAGVSRDNSIALTPAERRSEFAVYLRDEVGGAITAAKGRKRIPLTLG
jgi:hypothetical protein